MPNLPQPSPTVYLIAAGVLLFVLLAVFGTENLANLLSQLFEIVGRLVNDVAREIESAATTLTRMLGGVLQLHRRRAAPAAAPPGRSAATTQPLGGAPGSDSPSQSGVTQQPPQEEETPLTWVAETIFTRLLYLATVIVIVVSDFVFAILRLQAVLFPSLPAPKQDLSSLSLLIGAFFISIVLLTGALTLDFLDVLPEPVRLFPTLSPNRRMLLLAISVLSFVLTLVAVGLLFFQGQVLTSLASTFPAGAIFLATLIGVLQVLVVFLGAWGAIRGLAILLALLGGLIGLVLHIVAVALRWVGDAIDLIGTVVLRNLVLAIAALFGRRTTQVVGTPSKGSALSIIGFGDRSSSFAALLCEEVAGMYGRGGLLAAGTYSSEPAVQDAAHARLVRVGMNDISPLSAHDAEPLVTLKSHVQAVYARKKAVNKHLLWVVDGERAKESLGYLDRLKRETPDLTITILCLLPPEGVRKSDPRVQISKLFGQRQGQGERMITTTIMVDDRSPLYARYGEPLADKLVARSLSGMLLAPQHNPGNPSFLSVMRGLSDEHVFAALAVDTAGIDTSTTRREGKRATTESGSVSSEVAAYRTEEVAGYLLSGSPVTTVPELPAPTPGDSIVEAGVSQKPASKFFAPGPTTTVAELPKQGDLGIYVNFIVPIGARSQDFSTYRGLISKWLADKEDLYLYSVVEGSGVTIPDSTTRYDRYAQVGVLYPYAPVGVPELNRPSEGGN
jgi:hypothetical protein